MKKQLNIFISSILAGFCITIGAIIYLVLINMGHKILGSIFFGFGLFTIIQFGFHLYTGRVGNLLDKKPSYLIDLFTCMIGNFIGVILLTLLAKLTRTISPEIIDIATNIVNQKQADNPLSIFILSFFCGIMIYLACKGHALCPYSIGKALIVLLAVSIFILAGFEHCIANGVYYTIAGIFNWKAFGYFILMILGNGIGSVFIDGLIKLAKKFTLENKKS